MRPLYVHNVSRLVHNYSIEVKELVEKNNSFNLKLLSSIIPLHNLKQLLFITRWTQNNKWRDVILFYTFT